MEAKRADSFIILAQNELSVNELFCWFLLCLKTWKIPLTNPLRNSIIIKRSVQWLRFAAVLELVDWQAWGACVRMGVRVRLPSAAPKWTTLPNLNKLLSVVRLVGLFFAWKSWHVEAFGLFYLPIICHWLNTNSSKFECKTCKWRDPNSTDVTHPPP